MAITFNESTKIFTLQTAETTYQMMVGRYNILQHLYYGKRVDGSTMDYLLWGTDAAFREILMKRKGTGRFPWISSRRNFLHREWGIIVPPASRQ